jgi:hypothetical protein
VWRGAGLCVQMIVRYGRTKGAAVQGAEFRVIGLCVEGFGMVGFDRRLIAPLGVRGGNARRRGEEEERQCAVRGR